MAKKRGFKNFFRKLGGGLKKAVKGIGKVAGGAVKIVGSILPGPLGVAAKTVGDILSPAKVEKIVDAVAEQGEVKVEKIEETVIRAGGTQAEAVKVAETLTPAIAKFTGAKVNDTKSIANVTMMSKAKALFSKPITWLVLAGVAAFFFMGKNKRRRF